MVTLRCDRSYEGGRNVLYRTVSCVFSFTIWYVFIPLSAVLCVSCVFCSYPHISKPCMSYVELCENAEMRCEKNQSHDIADFCVQILKLTVVSVLKLYRTCVCMLSHEQVGLS